MGWRHGDCGEGAIIGKDGLQECITSGSRC